MNAYSTSICYAWAVAVGRALRAASRTARTVARVRATGEWLDRIDARLDTATANSRSGRVGATVAGWIRGSRLCQWATSDADAERVVIPLGASVVLSSVIGLSRWLAVRPPRGSLVSRVSERPLRLVGLALGTALVCDLALQLTTGLTPLSAVAHALSLTVVVALLRSRHTLSSLRGSLLVRWLLVLFEPPPRPRDDE